MKRRLLILPIALILLGLYVRWSLTLCCGEDLALPVEEPSSVAVSAWFHQDGLQRRLDIFTWSPTGYWTFDEHDFDVARLERLKVVTPAGAEVQTAELQYDSNTALDGGRFTMALPDLPVEVTELRVSGDFVVLRPDGGVFRSYAFDHTAKLSDEP